MLLAAAGADLLDSAHDLADGGLAQALVEACLRGDTGVQVSLSAGDPFVQLFSESAGRAMVSVTRANDEQFRALCDERGLPCTRIGTVDVLATDLTVEGQFRIPVRELRAAWSGTIPRRFQP